MRLPPLSAQIKLTVPLVVIPRSHVLGIHLSSMISFSLRNLSENLPLPFLVVLTGETTPAAAFLPLDGRVAIVTGGSRGIGRAIALHLRLLGAKIVINYASKSNQADQLVSELNTASNSHPVAVAVAVQANISEPDQVKLLFDRAEQEFGSDSHILVHSAGVMDSKYPTLANTTVEDWDMTFNVNARGAFLCCREAANRLKRGGGGRIIMISTQWLGRCYQATGHMQLPRQQWKQ